MKKALKIASVFAIVIVGYVVVYNAVFHYDSTCAKMQPFPLSDTVNPFYISESNYAATMQHIVLPLLDSLGKPGNFINGSDTIAYDTYLLDSPKANLVISHGFTERKEKFNETVYYFLKMGYQVFVMDHYSHGNSSHLNKDSSLVYVKNYGVFVDDLTKFVTNVAKPQSKGAKVILFGHSMGGGIAARTLEMHPNLVDGLILSAPLFKIGTPGAPPEFVAAPVCGLMLALGRGATYAIGQRPYVPEKDSAFDAAQCATTSVNRGKYWHYRQLAITQHPGFGSSWQLAAALLDLCHDVVKPAQVCGIKVPILLFQAENDTYVDPRGHYKFANHAANITCYKVAGARHEMYRERDLILIPYYNRLQHFVESVKKR